jgi:transposase InsO family protein
MSIVADSDAGSVAGSRVGSVTSVAETVRSKRNGVVPRSFTRPELFYYGRDPETASSISDILEPPSSMPPPRKKPTRQKQQPNAEVVELRKRLQQKKHGTRSRGVTSDEIEGPTIVRFTPSAPVGSVERLIEDQYSETPVGVHKLYHLLKTKHPDRPDLTRIKVQEFLRNNIVQQLHVTPRKRKTVQPFVPARVLSHLQADLIDFDKDGMTFRYVLLVVDLFSKYVWAKPAKNKQSKTIAKHMEEILTEIMALPIYEQNPIRMIQTDSGSEFTGKEFGQVLKDRGIRHVYSLSHTPTSQAVVERNVGTFKRLLSKYKMMHGGRWDQQLPKIIQMMNETMSTVHKRVPTMVLREPENYSTEVKQKFVKNAESRIKKLQSKGNPRMMEKLTIGDKVRLRDRNESLGFKGVHWIEEPATIKSIKRSSKPFRPYRYEIKLANGQTLANYYYREDLLKV